MGLVETKSANLSESWIRRVWGSFDFDWFSVKAVNGAVGLLCVWDKDFFVQNEVTIGDRWICIKGFIQEIDISCTIGLMYGPHSIYERRKVWGELKEVKERFGVPLLLMGDFNEILKVGKEVVLGPLQEV